MRTGLTIICVTIIVGLLVGMSLSSVMAQGEDLPGMTFHVIGYHVGTDGTENVDTIPADAPDVIVISGSYTNGTAANTFKLQAVIGNLCDTVATGTGTPTVAPTATATLAGSPNYDRPECAPVPIYYQVQLSINWDSNWEDNCGFWGYCSRALPPTIHYQMGGSSNPTTESFACGTLAKAGSCSYSDTGIISAEDLRNAYFNNLGTGEYWNEKFKLTADYNFGTGGNITTNYTIMLSTLPFDTGCAGQYNIGATLGSFTLAATNSAGVNLKTVLGASYPAPGQWYVVEVTSGYWQNNGSGAQLKSLGKKEGLSGSWDSLSTDPMTGCSDEANATYYLQMVSIAPVFIRVDDTDGNFASNTGTMVISISAVTAYSAYPDGCELQYQVGDLIEQRTVAADQVNGWPLKVSTKYGTGGSGTDLQPIRYYMLETIGGPANLGLLGAEDLTWSVDLGQREDQIDLVPGAWYESTAAPFVTCSRTTDQVGHVRVFFAADSQAELKGAITDYYYALRVRDTGSYVGNSGSLGYRLYEATNMQMTVPGETPDANGCASFSKGTPLTGSVVIQASNVFGMQLPALTSLSLYALEVTDGPWHEAGSTASYGVEISDDDGTTWTDIQDYPNLLCAASADGDHVIIYVYGAAGKTWKVRANDTDSNFGTNTNSIGMDVYPGLTAINQWPACESDYNLTKVVLDAEVRKIPGNIAGGKAIPATSILGASRTYAVEITTDSKWFEAGAGTGSYLVDISDDGGTTWTALEDYNSLCTEQVGDGDRFRVVFTATSNNYKLRVRDGDSNYLNNTGYVAYDLYTAISNNYTPGPGTTTPAPAEWVVACSERYSRPSSFIEWYPIVDFTQWGATFTSISFPVPRAAEWIDYLRNAITFYFAWCPQHTDALKSLGAVALNKEPMKSIVDMVTFIKSIQSLFDSYRAVGGAGDPALVSQEPDLFGDTSSIGQGVGGGSGPDAPVYHGGGAWDLFITSTLDPATNIWAGGKVDFTTAMDTTDPASTAAYRTLCGEKFTPLFGITTTSFCSLLANIRNNGIVKWLVLAMDLIAAVWFLLGYFPSYLRRFIRVVGGKRAV